MMNDIRTMFIQSSEGGRDARNFAYLLFGMYVKYFDNLKIKITVSFIATVKEEFQEATITFAYEDVLKSLLSEEGIHRLVRVSPYDKKGKRHTSFVHIFFIQQQNIKIEINKKDIRVDCFRAGGKGGQNVNKVSSAVRIVHIPTKISVESQKERNQIANKQDAMQRLKEKLLEYETERLKHIVKKSVTSWGKQIRTYSFITEKVVNHENKKELSIYDVLQGKITDLLLS